MKRENWRRSRVCLRDKVVAVCNSTVAASATWSRDKVAHSCAESRDKIAGVTSVSKDVNAVGLTSILDRGQFIS